MLTTLSALCKANTKKFALTNFLRCDFKGIEKSYKPGFEDAVSILPESYREKAVEMDEFLRSIECKIRVQPLKNTTLHSKWKLSYKRRGKSIYGFHSDTDSLDTFAYYNHPDNVSRMGYLLREESDQLYSWFFDSFPTNICSCQYNRRVDLGGRLKRICGFSNRLVLNNPDKDDMQNLKRSIEIFRDKILIYPIPLLYKI